eukprot:CAMPEP_0172042452 /NCGR_PEP_ID=MMETSP1041-20130122/25690_1 /TAXON_ID=464988 /ORGANISM="Hemiselmis andersenii, Strain CCMP439" /LENGTH=133 /DNA_ID=CAMNT_0012700719 /DNA_START=123 /DNA_END=521 /DNA_ORIENTATION=-
MAPGRRGLLPMDPSTTGKGNDLPGTARRASASPSPSFLQPFLPSSPFKHRAPRLAATRGEGGGESGVSGARERGLWKGMQGGQTRFWARRVRGGVTKAAVAPSTLACDRGREKMQKMTRNDDRNTCILILEPF